MGGNRSPGPAKHMAQGVAGAPGGRYRHQRNGWVTGDTTLKCWCFELQTCDSLVNEDGFYEFSQKFQEDIVWMYLAK